MEGGSEGAEAEHSSETGGDRNLFLELFGTTFSLKEGQRIIVEGDLQADYFYVTWHSCRFPDLGFSASTFLPPVSMMSWEYEY